MIIVIMINRGRELGILEEVYNSRRAELVLLYGRRRVGKSRILVESIKGRTDAQYLLCDMSDNVLEILARQVSGQFVRFGSWDDFFEYVMKGPHRIIIIDEFQYLALVDSAWPTILQRWWERLKETDRKIVLCGSILSTIYRISTGYGSALYGRRTRDIHVEPLRFRDVRRFLKGYDIAEVVRAYAVLGGVPGYLEEFDTSQGVRENIRKHILDRSSFLHNEPMNLMFEEFKDPSSYISIISTILAGHRRFNEISDHTHISGSTLPKYLTVLERIRIIERETPVTESALKSKKTLYRVSDSFYAFWFTFVHPNLHQFELGLEDAVMESIDRGLDLFVSAAFERICQQAAVDAGLILPTRIGRQWGTVTGAPKGDNAYEIDILAMDTNGRKALFGECKWQKNVDAPRQLELLKRKASNVQLKGGKYDLKYVLFATSFKDKIDGVCLDLKDFGRIYG
jgi:hypothetical protein